MDRKLEEYQTATTDDMIFWIGALIGLPVLIWLDNKGFPQKWHAAVVWTEGAFFGMLLLGRKRWRTWLFWSVWAILLFLHVLAMSLIFARVLVSISKIGTVFVLPFAFVEALMIEGISFRLQRRLHRLHTLGNP